MQLTTKPDMFGKPMCRPTTNEHARQVPRIFGFGVSIIGDAKPESDCAFGFDAADALGATVTSYRMFLPNVSNLPKK